MSVGQHTPGPWAVSKNSSGRRVTSTRGVVICNAVLRNTGSVQSGVKHGAKAEAEALANARLIAAAPDQHGALLAIADWLHGLALDGPDEHTRKGARINAAIADAAIARATGAA